MAFTLELLRQARDAADDDALDAEPISVMIDGLSRERMKVLFNNSSKVPGNILVTFDLDDDREALGPERFWTYAEAKQRRRELLAQETDERAEHALQITMRAWGLQHEDDATTIMETANEAEAPD